jgi:hypothetical protein
VAHDHHHAHAPARAAAPTLSLLRMSAGGRLVGAAALIGVLWALVLAVLA